MELPDSEGASEPSPSAPPAAEIAPLRRNAYLMGRAQVRGRWPRSVSLGLRESRFVTEARLEDAGSGLAPVTEGWFVVNVRDAEWFSSETRGAACWFANEYGESPVEFPQFGINVTVLEPGQSIVYHAESNQEAFLVLGGECRLLVEGEERYLRAWDFFHCPPWTEHAFVGAGDGPCAILMVGAHLGPEVRYPVSELAARYGASVEKETSDPEQVYATAERFRRERPTYWSGLPWA
jgi:quercetin dioxygenase-like cupin family protein